MNAKNKIEYAILTNNIKNISFTKLEEYFLSDDASPKIINNLLQNYFDEPQIFRLMVPGPFSHPSVTYNKILSTMKNNINKTSSITFQSLLNRNITDAQAIGILNQYAKVPVFLDNHPKILSSGGGMPCAIKRIAKLSSNLGIEALINLCIDITRYIFKYNNKTNTPKRNLNKKTLRMIINTLANKITQACAKQTFKLSSFNLFLLCEVLTDIKKYDIVKTNKKFQEVAKKLQILEIKYNEARLIL